MDLIYYDKLGLVRCLNIIKKKEKRFLYERSTCISAIECVAFCVAHIGQSMNYEDNFLSDDFYLLADIQKQILYNEYCFVSNPTSSKVRLFAVSDGMGGHNAGEVASRLCVEKLASVYEVLQRYSSLKDIVAYLQTVIAEINNTVCELSRKHSHLKGMGATLVLFVVYGTEYAILNIGDSRAYYFDHKELLIQVTKDHTEGQRMLDIGLLTKEELSGFPARKNLNRYIGYGQPGYILRADEYYPTLENGVMLLCSDGISDSLSDSRISEILRSESNLEIAGKQLINEAVAVQNADNATAILISLRR